MLFSEPKIPQCFGTGRTSTTISGFSALQRAENSSIIIRAFSNNDFARFQCSSASRKFLNANRNAPSLFTEVFQCSSASRKFLNSRLQTAAQSSRYWFQCSSASRKFLNAHGVMQVYPPPPAFQCSSASRKFLNLSFRFQRGSLLEVSVLFSEPKIPQSRPSHLRPSIFPTAMITLRHS